MGELLLPTLYHGHEIAPGDPSCRDEITAFHRPNHEIGDHPEAVYFRMIDNNTGETKEEHYLDGQGRVVNPPLEPTPSLMVVSVD
jgi:hypothetical protein